MTTIAQVLRLDASSGALSRISATALLAATVCALVDLLSERHLFALVAALLIVLHTALRWRDVRTSARVMFFAAIATTGVFMMFDGSVDKLAQATSHALYLPALLAVMTLLRVATQRSRLVELAARSVIEQPPSRRFLFLAAGSHIFGILLNVGGLQLLLNLALAHGQKGEATKDIRAIRSRRITNAVLRGFGATLLWSPVGVAINILIPLMHKTDWFAYAPYGLGLVAAFIGFGWLFDQSEPRPKRRASSVRHVGAITALFSILMLLVAITGAAVACELLLGVPLRAAILVVIPLMAAVWVLVTEPGPSSASITSLVRDGFATLPRAVNEVCLIGSTSLLGLVLAQMIPPDAVRLLVNEFALGHGFLACCVVVTITAAGFVGVSPMISGTILVSAILAGDVGMPEPMLLVAALSGWSGAMMLSPVTATVAIAASATGCPSTRVGLRWNGAFAVSFLLLTMLVLLAWGHMA